MAKRVLGTFTHDDLGLWVQEPPLPADNPMRRNHRPTKGRIESVHHFRVDGVNYTACIVWIPRTQAQIDNREPDHREIRGHAEQEVEVTKNG